MPYGVLMPIGFFDADDAMAVFESRHRLPGETV
jgi:hypothetical protein